MDFAGVDKVALRVPLDGCRVRDLRGWGEKVGRKVGEDPPAFLRDASGDTVPGAGFFRQLEHAIADINPSGLRVIFNPSKIRHPYHLLTDPVEVGRIGDAVERSLRSNGVDVSVDAMQLVRLDLAKQKQLTHQLSTYVPALAHLQGKRMKGHQYPEGYAWRNTQREAVFYNKAREVHEKQRLMIPEGRLGRIEAKWRDGRPLAKDFQFSSFGDLRRSDPAALTDVYRNALHRNVFRTDPRAVQLVLHYDTDLDIYRSMKRQIRYGAFWQYLALGHIPATVEAHGGIDGLQRFMLDAGDNARTVRHNIQQLRSRLQRDAFLNARRDEAAVNVHTLLDELRNAFAA